MPRQSIGKFKTKEYRSWSSMLTRCYNAKSPPFANYGGRGIIVCDRWHMFSNFLADMGPAPSAKHSLDRFPNQNGNYEPGNCRWATRIEQNRNKRTNKLLTHSGKTLLLAEWAEVTGLRRDCISARLRHGWSVAEALTTPANRSLNNYWRRRDHQEAPSTVTE